MRELHSQLKFAYSRPGFLTFKSEKEIPPDFELNSIFAHSYGITLFKFKWTEWDQIHEKIMDSNVHVIEREQFAPDEFPKEFEYGKLKEKFLLQNKNFIEKIKLDQAPTSDALIYDLIIVDENEIWLGAHIHSDFHRPFVGGRPNIALPAEAPSRAYLKLEEVVQLYSIKLSSNDTAIEIGSAPGGASFALLQRGLKVVGVDAAKMDPVVMKNQNFFHIQKAMADVKSSELPKQVQWILIDINQKPEIAIQSLQSLIQKYENSLKGIFLTLKLNDWKNMLEIKKIQNKLFKFGFEQVCVAHLISNKKEVSLCALK